LSILVIQYGLRGLVRRAINFDGKMNLRTIKIQYINADTVLASESLAIELFASQKTPQPSLGACHVTPKFTPALFELASIEYLRHVLPFPQSLQNCGLKMNG